MNQIDKVKKYIEMLPVKLSIIEFQEDTATSELAAKALDVEVGQIAKSLLFVGKEKSVLIVTCGDMRVDQKKLKNKTGLKMRMADSNTLIEVTGFYPGGVCPFALKTTIPIYLDASLQRFPIVYAAAGNDHSAVPVTLQQLEVITGGEIVDLSC